MDHPERRDIVRAFLEKAASQARRTMFKMVNEAIAKHSDDPVLYEVFTGFKQKLKENKNMYLQKIDNKDIGNS